MTATAQPPAPTPGSPRPPLARAEGVELLGEVHGSGYSRGAALVRRADGQMVQLGPLMYALLDEIDGSRDTRQLAAALCDRLDRACDEEAVVQLAQKLAAQGLLAGTEGNAPPRPNPLLALRWKVLVTSPRGTAWLTRPFMFLFFPLLAWPLVAAFAVVLWFVLLRKGLASGAAQAFDKPGLLLLVFLLSVASAGFHEIGHAVACRYGGARPSGIGMGIYMVWPAFYTDVTDSYRLPRRDRLRVDLGGIYFNAVVAVATTAVWLAWRADSLLLLVAIQALMIVKNLSPVIRSDGYHILADLTGVPDLYAHIGPTMRRLIPGREREPSALRGRARVLVTAWVLVVVPLLLSLVAGAILLLPRMLASAWSSGHVIAGGIPHEVVHGQILALLAACLRLLALVLPLLGSVLIAQRLLRGALARLHRWSAGRPLRRVALVGVSCLAAAGAALAWWPSGQYQAIGARDRGTLLALGHALASPARIARPRPTAAPAVALPPGRYLAVAMIPKGGATKERPALLVIPGTTERPPVAILSPESPNFADTQPAGTGTASTGAATTSRAASGGTDAPVDAAAFPFKLPPKPGPGSTQAVAVGTRDGGVTYDIAYSLVTVSGGAPVTNTNSAFAFASCRACTTVAVSFQVVLVVGTSKVIAPIDAAGALNANCPACITVAVADQIVVTLKEQPTPDLVARITAALRRLDALRELGADASPAAIAAGVEAVQQQIDSALRDSGQLADPQTATTRTSTSPTTTASTVPTTPLSTTTAPTTTASSTTTAPPATVPTTTTAPSTTAPTTDPGTTTTESTTTAPATTTAPTTTDESPTTTSPGG